MPDSKDSFDIVWKVWKVSDRCQDGVLMLSGQCLDGLWNSYSDQFQIFGCKFFGRKFQGKYLISNSDKVFF